MAKAVGTRELAEWVGKKASLSTKQARTAIKLTFEGIALNLKKTDKVNITGIGSFSKKVKPATRGGKKAINPFTGAEYTTKSKPASTKVKFRPGSGFKTILGK